LEWHRVARDLYDAGVLTGVDRAALEGYCMAYARRVKAELMIQKEGEVIPTSYGGQQSAWQAVYNKADKQVHDWAVEFGMTASSRSRIHVDKPGKEASLAELLFSGVNDADE
jgi:P27 family predicted phage terminase small subunit